VYRHSATVDRISNVHCLPHSLIRRQ
jgi:hypothetical protein